MGKLKSKQNRLKRLRWQIKSHQNNPQLTKRLQARYQTIERTEEK